MSEPDKGWSGVLADVFAGLWLLGFLYALVGLPTLALMKMRIVGSVEAALLVRTFGLPLVIGVVFILVVGSLAAMKELYGRRTTNSSIGNVLELWKKAGRAEALQEQIDRDRNRGD